MKEKDVNREILRDIGSAIVVVALETEHIDNEVR